MQAANIVPNNMVMKDAHLGKDEKQSNQKEPEDILSEVDLSRISEWTTEEHVSATSLLKEYFCIFCKGDYDLGKISIVKHKIR